MPRNTRPGHFEHSAILQLIVFRHACSSAWTRPTESIIEDIQDLQIQQNTIQARQASTRLKNQ